MIPPHQRQMAHAWAAGVVASVGAFVVEVLLALPVLRLSPTDLRIQDSFAPTNWQALDQADADIGSLAPTLLSNLGLVFQAGKTGQLGGN